MILYECVNVERNSTGKIIGYQLINDMGEKGFVKSSTLKKYIESSNFYITNVKLTKDGRLIVKKHTKRNTADSLRYSKSLREKHAYITTKKGEQLSMEDVEKLLAKANLLGKTRVFKSMIDNQLNTLYIYSLSDKEHIIYIPENVVSLQNQQLALREISDLEGHVMVVGGSTLTNAVLLFNCSKADSFDFSLFDTSNVLTMSGMFWGVSAPILDLSNFNTPNLVNISSMFYECKSQRIILGNMNVDNVLAFQDMLKGCTAECISVSEKNQGLRQILSLCSNQYKGKIELI